MEQENNNENKMMGGAASSVLASPNVQQETTPTVNLDKVVAESTGQPLSTDVTIEALLEECVKHDASDLHLQAGLPPVLRIDGVLRPLTMYPIMTDAIIQRLVYSTLDANQKMILNKDKEFDYSFAFGDVARFRANAFYERGNMAVAFRLIPSAIKTIEDLGLPESSGRLRIIRTG